MKHIVGLSFGKDSTCMALALQEREPRDYIYVCTPTGDELPEMVEHMVRIEQLLGQPVLADRCEDDGCEDEAILAHLRQTHRQCSECHGQCGGATEFREPDGRVHTGFNDSWLPCTTCKGKGRLEVRHVRGCWSVDILL